MGGFCCSTLMKVFAILLCLLVALCVAYDMQATCTVFDTVGCGSAASIDLGDWTEVTVNATSSLCYTAAYTTDDSDEDYFVIAVRPGGDAANATLPAAKALCAQVQSAQEDDDMDYACSALANTTAAGSTGNVTLKVVNTGAAAATLEIYAGFADGDACGASLVSSGGSWWWIVIVLIVIVVIIVIAAAVGGFLYMKKKSSYQLY